jgi:hypothetical protein
MQAPPCEANRCTHPLLSSDARGLSTIEYALLFALICIGCLALWHKLERDLDCQVGVGTQRFGSMSSGATATLPEHCRETQAGVGKPPPIPVHPYPNQPQPPPASGASPPPPPPPAAPPPAPPPAAAKPPSAGAAVTTGLGPKADAVVAQSPTLSQQVQSLKSQGWTIRYGQPGGGGFTDESRKEIVIDPDDQQRGAKVVASSLAHETGHALNPTATVPASGLTRAEYIAKNTQAQLLEEAKATLNNTKVRDEILKNGGPDIGIDGKMKSQYKAIYTQYAAGKLTQTQAEQKIAQLIGNNETTSNTHQNYQTYYAQTYAKAWDQAYPNKPKNFKAP